MNLVRSIMSVFLVILLGLSVAGWIWAGGQPSPKLEGARLVLALCGLSALGCLWLLWSARPGVRRGVMNQSELKRATSS